MKRWILLVVLALVLCSCGRPETPEGTYAAKDGENSFCVVLSNGYCMIDVISINDSDGYANEYVCGEYTVEDDRVKVAINEKEGIDEEVFEFEFDEDALVNVADGKVYKKREPEKISADGEYYAEHKDMSFNLGIVGDSCNLDVFSVNEQGQTGTATSVGTVKTEGNILTLEFSSGASSGQKYRFIYSEASGILLDTADGKIFERVE